MEMFTVYLSRPTTRGRGPVGAVGGKDVVRETCGPKVPGEGPSRTEPDESDTVAGVPPGVGVGTRVSYGRTPGVPGRSQPTSCLSLDCPERRSTSPGSPSSPGRTVVWVPRDRRPNPQSEWTGRQVRDEEVEALLRVLPQVVQDPVVRPLEHEEVYPDTPSPPRSRPDLPTPCPSGWSPDVP